MFSMGIEETSDMKYIKDHLQITIEIHANAMKYKQLRLYIQPFNLNHPKMIRYILNL